MFQSLMMMMMMMMTTMMTEIVLETSVQYGHLMQLIAQERRLHHICN
jgi:hypothetical protein